MKIFVNIEKNGYYNLNDDLKQKFDIINSKDIKGKISKYLTCDEFCEIFINTTFLFKLYYKDVEYCLSNEGNSFYFYSEGNNNIKSFTNKYNSALELLKESTINNKHLKDLWEEFDID